MTNMEKSRSTDSIPLLQSDLGLESVSNPRETIALEFSGANQATFDQRYGRIPPEKLTPKTFADKLRRRFQCSRQCLMSGLRRYVPVIDLVTSYKPKEYILGDVIAGISTAVMQVPQSMGYSLLANLPPIIGLYTSFFPVLVYFIFGRSRHNSIGTMAVTSLIIASSISKGLPLFVNDNQELIMGVRNGTLENATYGYDDYPKTHQDHLQDEDIDSPVVQEKIRIAMTVSLIAGLCLLSMALLKLGIIASYISEPFYAGFIAAINVQVLTHQVKHLLGINVGSYSGPLSYFYTLRDICLNLKNTTIATMIISIIAITILILIKKLINERYADRLKTPVPIDLIVVVVATIISYYCRFETRFGVKIIKVIPQGLPTPATPSIENFDFYLIDGVMLGLINYVMVFMMVKMFADKHNYPYDANQELLATGLCAVSGSFFSSMAASTSPPRCILSEQTGCRTQLTQLISAGIVLLTMLFIAPLFQALPICILSALIVVCSLPLFRYYKICVEYWKTSKIDLIVWTISMVATTLMGIDIGILIGLVASVLSVLVRTQLPYISKLKLVSGDRFIIDGSKYECKSAPVVDGLALLRFEAPLYFATIDIFKNKVFSMTAKPADLLGNIQRESDKKNKKLSKKDKANGNTQGSSELKVDDPEPRKQLMALESHAEKLQPIKTIILDCSAMPFVDTTGAKTLAFLHREYKKAGVRFQLANVVETVRDTLTRTESCVPLLASDVYPSVYDAVVASTQQAENGGDGTKEV